MDTGQPFLPMSDCKWQQYEFICQNARGAKGRQRPAETVTFHMISIDPGKEDNLEYRSFSSPTGPIEEAGFIDIFSIPTHDCDW